MTIEIRQATKDDIPDIAKIHVSGWQTSGEGIVDQNYLNTLDPKDREKEWHDRFEKEEVDMLLAVKESSVCGFVNYGRLQTAPAGTSKIRPLYSSEIYAIYLLPDYFGHGIGKNLFQSAVKKLKEDKHQSMCLWSLKGNKRACSFYDSFGGQRIGKKVVELGPTKAKEVCYGWRDINVILDK